MANKVVKWIVGGVALVALLSGLAYWKLGRSAKKDDLFVVKTWTRKDCGVTPWVVAENLGFLKEEGIRIQWTGETQPALQIPSILRGDNDVSGAHPNTLAVAKAGGAKITGVAEGGLEPIDPTIDAQYRHMWWFVNPKKHPEVKSFADLKSWPADKKIKIATITVNICSDFETKLLADRYGIARDRIEWVTMPDVQAIQALDQGLVDISEVHPPFYKGMKDSGALKIADSAETGLGASAGITYWFFRDEFIEKHPKEVAAFVRAMVKAQKWANEHPDEARKMTQEAIGVPVNGNHYYSTSLKVNEAYADPWINDLTTAGVIKPGSVSTATLVTHKIEEINARYSLR